MRWLITGGAGFIGSNLVAHLLRVGGETNEILILDNLTGSSIEGFSSTDGVGEVKVLQPGEKPWASGGENCVQFVVGDIRDAETVAHVCAGADVLVHLAANTGVQPSVKNPRLDCEINIFGLMNCLEAAREAGIRRFVFASSGAPAGLCEPPITENIAPRPASPYGASKLAGEAYCCAYTNTFNLPTVALRFSNVYGPNSWRKGSVVAKFIRQAIAGEVLTINGDGSQTRDFIYVEDLVRAILLAAQRDDASGEIFQIATGVETSISSLLEMMTPKLVAAGIPEPRIAYGALGAGDVARNYADPAKARRVLGWEPQANLVRGLDATIEWFRQIAPERRTRLPDGDQVR